MPVFTWRRDTKDKDVYTNEPYTADGIRRTSSTTLDTTSGGLRGYGNTGSPGQQLRHSLSAKPSSGRYNSSNNMGGNIGQNMSIGTSPARPGSQGGPPSQFLSNNAATAKQSSGSISAQAGQTYRSSVRTPSSPNRVYRNMTPNSYTELARPATASVVSRQQATMHMHRPTTSMGTGTQEHGMSMRYSAPQEATSPSHLYNSGGMRGQQHDSPIAHNGLWQSMNASPGTPTAPYGQQKSSRLVDSPQPAGLPPPSPSRPGSFKFMPRSSSARHEQHSSLLASLMVQQVVPGASGASAQSRILTLTPQPASKQRKASGSVRGLSGSASSRPSARQSVHAPSRDAEAASAEAQMLQRRFSTGSVAGQQQWAAAAAAAAGAQAAPAALAWHGAQPSSVNSRLAEAWGTLTCVRPSTTNASNFAVAFAAESQQEMPDVYPGSHHAHSAHHHQGHGQMHSQDEPTSPGVWDSRAPHDWSSGAKAAQDWAHGGQGASRSPRSSGHLGHYQLNTTQGAARHQTSNVTHAFASPQAQQLMSNSSAASSKGSHVAAAKSEGVTSVEGHSSNPSAGWVTALTPGHAWGSHSGSADGSHASADMQPPPPGQHWSGVEETSSQSVMIVQSTDQRQSKVKARSPAASHLQHAATQAQTHINASATAVQGTQNVGKSDQGQHTYDPVPHATAHAHPHEDTAQKQRAVHHASASRSQYPGPDVHSQHSPANHASAAVQQAAASSRLAHASSHTPAASYKEEHQPVASPASSTQGPHAGPAHTSAQPHVPHSTHQQQAPPHGQAAPPPQAATPAAPASKTSSGAVDARGGDTSTNPLHMFVSLASKKVPVYPPKLPLPVDEETLLGGHINAEHTTALPGYAVGKVIGEGGFCQVRLAVHRLSGRRVAVKIIDKLKLADAAEARRIQREIRVMRHLSHECIIKLFEVVDAPNILYLVMEHAPNGSLLDYVRSRKRLAEADASIVTQQIVAGLASCHQREVVHRDIKLENILMDTNNCMKLIDFGLSAFFIPGKQLRVHCGSPSYAAPEIVSRKHYDGPPVDVWSLGVVLFAMLAGHLPFHSSSGNKQELCAKIQEGRYTCPEHVGVQARDLLSRMLCVDPSKRITLDQVAAHPWLTQGARWDPLGASVYMVKVDPSAGLVYADEQLVVELEAAGYSRSMVLQHLLSGETNYLVAGYYLLAEGKAEVIRRMRGALAAQRYIARSAPNAPANATELAGLPLTPTSCTAAAAMPGKLTAPPPSSAVVEKAVAVVVPRATIPVG